MPAPIVVPFNFEPISTARQATSYTIPAGRYAHAIPTDIRATLNGVEIFAGSNTISQTVGAGVTAGYDLGQNFTGKISWDFISSTKNCIIWGTSSDGAAIVQNTLVFLSNADGIRYIENGTVLSGQNAVTTGTELAPYSISVVSSGTGSGVLTVTKFLKPQPLWVKAGDVLAGCPWIVTEYNKIS